jgi:hypothetical protein
MPCDWAFARTEKIKWRKEYDFVPEEWYDIVSSGLQQVLPLHDNAGESSF